MAKELPELRRYRLVLIDESQNLRNREGKRYKAIQEYIGRNDSKCILLSATPYNKTYLDLGGPAAPLRPRRTDLGIRPEQALRRDRRDRVRRGGTSAAVRSLAAFEKSDYADDWRDLMRLYLVRRTRSFIRDNYATDDPITRPEVPAARRRHADPTSPSARRARSSSRSTTTIADDQYALLYSGRRWRSDQCASPCPATAWATMSPPHRSEPPTPGEADTLDEPLAGRQAADGLLPHQPVQAAGERRRRLRAVGRAAHPAQLRLPPRHRERAALPIGTQDADLLDAARQRRGRRRRRASLFADDDDGNGRHATRRPPPAITDRGGVPGTGGRGVRGVRDTLQAAVQVAAPVAVRAAAGDDLRHDAHALLGVLRAMRGMGRRRRTPSWPRWSNCSPNTTRREKVLVFTQFADTARYLAAQLAGARRITHLRR